MQMRNRVVLAVGLLVLGAAARAGGYEPETTTGLVCTASPGSITGPDFGRGSCSASGGGGGGGATVGGTIRTVFRWHKAKDASGD